MLKKYLKPIVTLVNQTTSRYYLRFFREKNSLLIFYLHGLFRDQKEFKLNIVNPQSHRGFLVEHFRQVVEYFLNHKYKFISPDEILKGLENYNNYVMVTFDDGYFNNQNALPILKNYKIPAVFFISANHVKYNKCFWGDILYRERLKSGTSVPKISSEIQHLKSKTSTEVETYIIDTFGEETLKPISDIDRPFTPSELREFSKEKYVFLGNHTNDHAILTNYSPNEVKSQILDAQDTIYEMTGVTPSSIAYPCGEYSNEVIRVAKEAGLKLGFTIDSKKNYLPLNLEGDKSMRLGRFLLHGNDKLVKQCEAVRSDIMLHNMFRALSGR